MNNNLYKKSNNKIKAIISVIAILLVFSLVAGATTYFYKDEAKAFISSIPVLKNIMKTPGVKEPILEEPVTEEPIKTLVYTSTPFIEDDKDHGVKDFYINLVEFENIVLNNIDKFSFSNIGQYGLNSNSEFFSFYIQGIDTVSHNGFTYTMPFKVIKIKDVLAEFGKSYDFDIVTEFTENDFVLVAGSYFPNHGVTEKNCIIHKRYPWFYPVLYATVSLFIDNEAFSINCDKGFNNDYINSDGLLDYQNLYLDYKCTHFANSDVSNKVYEYTYADYIKYSDVVSKVFGTTKFIEVLL